MANLGMLVGNADVAARDGATFEPDERLAVLLKAADLLESRAGDATARMMAETG